MKSNLEKFMEEFSKAYTTKTFKKIVISKSIQNNQEIKKISTRLLTIQGEEMFSFVFEYQTKTITKNFFYQQAIEELYRQIEHNFKNTILFTEYNDISLVYNKKMKSQLIYAKPTHKNHKETGHNKTKNRAISLTNNIYLKELGVVNDRNQVNQSMQSKYKQINKYIETIQAIIKNSDLAQDKNLTVVDMGSGKGYLTFALYDFLRNISKHTVKMIGVEMRSGLVDLCNSIAKQCAFDDLSFCASDIDSFQTSTIDILIALHACDTATDDAIYKGIQANSSIIVVAPCCHKQIRKELHIENELQCITKHGILEERMAESVTDTLRSLVLESFGYKTQIFEFISDEHTHKNVMIVATQQKNITNTQKEAKEKITQLKRLFGIKNFYLEEIVNKQEN